MGDINHLIRDMRLVMGSPLGEPAAKDVSLEIAANVGYRMQRALTRVERPRKPNVLFPSELGHPCDRKTWYEFHYNPATMHLAEGIGDNAKLKFAYGDIVESLVIPLAKASGHDIDRVDETVQWTVPDTGGRWMVRGRIDMAVDGHIVDVKSMAARSYDRWMQDGIGADSFGYSFQLASYQLDSLGVPMMRGHPRYVQPYILAIDKEGGKMALHASDNVDVVRAAKTKAAAVDCPTPHVLSRIAPVPDGKSGNMKLAVACAYCKYKRECWRDANGGKGLRKFIYSFGPVWLTEVVYVPRVREETGG